MKLKLKLLTFLVILSSFAIQAMEPAKLSQSETASKGKEKPLFDEVYIKREVEEEYNKYLAPLMQARKDNDEQKIRKILDNCSYYAASMLAHEIFDDTPLLTVDAAENSPDQKKSLKDVPAPQIVVTFKQTLLDLAEGEQLRNSCKSVQEWDYIKEFLKNITDINGTDINGHPPLYTALAIGNPRLTKFMLDHGAKANVISHDGKVALNCIPSRTIDNVPLLLTHGAPLPIKNDPCGVSSVYISVFMITKSLFMGHLFESLIYNDMKLFRKLAFHATEDELHMPTPHNGMPILQWAVCRQNKNAVKILLSLARSGHMPCSYMRSLLIDGKLPRRLNIDQQDEEKRTALIWAGHLGQRQIYHDLLLAGANSKIQDNRGLTASDHAIRYGHIDPSVQLN